MKIIGIEESKGSFEGKDYHNVIFHCTKPIEAQKGMGFQAKSIKVKSKVLIENFGKQLTLKEITSFVGQEANFYYDEFKNVSYVAIESAAK